MNYKFFEILGGKRIYVLVFIPKKAKDIPMNYV